jgi:hypothetical protein
MRMMVRQLYEDEHAKSMARGPLNWFRNIYIPGVMSTPY